MTIVELMGQLKRTFATIRLYGLAHENARLAEAQLHQALTAYLDVHGSVCWVVRPSTIEVNDKKVYEDERKEDSLVRALFVDGVESLTVLAGITREELSVLVSTWYNAVTSALGVEHSFATAMWENELASIGLAVRSGLSEQGVDDDADANKAAEGRMQQVFAALTAAVTEAHVQRVDGASLALVQAVLGDVSAEDLRRRSNQDEARGLDLSKAERAQLVSGLASSGRGAGQRSLYALSKIAAGAAADHRDEVGHLVTRVVGELVRAGRLGELARAMTRVQSPELAEAVARPEVVNSLVRDGSGDAWAVLGALPAHAVDLLAEPFAQAAPELRAKLASIIADKRPSGEVLATWLLAFGNQVAAPLFELSERLEPTTRELLLRTALVHDDREVVLRGLSKIPAPSLGDYESLVRPGLDHADSEVRRAALGVFVRSHSPDVPALIEAQLNDAAAATDWQKSCVHLLGTMRGEGAYRLLASVLHSDRPREVRVAAASALGNSEAPGARRSLEQEAQRFLGDRAIKRAARDALKRLDKRRSSLTPEPGGSA